VKEESAKAEGEKPAAEAENPAAKTLKTHRDQSPKVAGESLKRDTMNAMTYRKLFIAAKKE